MELASRRQALGALALGAAATALTRTALSAQQATPVAGAGSWAVVESLIRDAEAAGGVVGVAVYGAEGGAVYPQR